MPNLAGPAVMVFSHFQSKSVHWIVLSEATVFTGRAAAWFELYLATAVKGLSLIMVGFC